MSLEDNPTFLDAVIVRYASGNGVLLCQRESDSSILETFSAYKDKPGRKTNWLVNFNANCLTLKSRIRIKEMQSELKGKRNENPLPGKIYKKRHSNPNQKVSQSTFQKLDDCLIGYLVRCAVAGGPKWKVIEVAIDFQAKFQIKSPMPVAKKRPPKTKKAKKWIDKSSLRKGQTSGDRMSRLHSKGSNLGRPWQG